MQLPKLTPLQSRFAASFAATLVLVLLYLAFSNPHLAYAQDVDSISHEDHNHPLILQNDHGDEVYMSAAGDADHQSSGFEPEPPNMSRSIIGRQATSGVFTMQNNMPQRMSIAPGDTQCFMFPQTALDQSSSLLTQKLPPSSFGIDESLELNDQDVGHTGSELRKRQASDHEIYLTLSVCAQPSATVNEPSGPPPALELFVSLSDGSDCPGPTFNGQQNSKRADGGFFNYTDSTSGDSYFAVSAPQNTGFSGNYSYELTASIDTPYTFYQDFQSLFFVDSDQNSSIFITTNLTTSNSTIQQEAWMDSGSPFSIFMHDSNDVMVQGILNSYCGLNNSAQLRTMADVKVDMTSIAGGFPKQQYYVQGLDKSTTYLAVMALDGNFTQSKGAGSPGGGGIVWQAINMTTKSGDNCELINNLDFCDSVAYAVPRNRTALPDGLSLANYYDNYASAMFTYFEWSLEQIPCTATPEAQYSLATGCANCSAAYKQWLCAVTIPRCVDYSSNEPYLQARNVNQSFFNGTMPTDEFGDPAFSQANKSVMYLNSSRVPQIDNDLQPGPYKELLPCIGLCYGLVQNCPAALGFACPLAGKGQNHSYGYATNGSLTCNIPGAIWGVSGASGLIPGLTVVWSIFFAVLGLSIMGV
ncbi:stretch-activated cation channel mid1 [Lambiella insularis]|nr:stretch-activated cation channel mid1 [Lambiella insularis]